jgi:hypothetical protein
MLHLLLLFVAEARYGGHSSYGPLLRRLTVPEALLMDLFESSCLPCLEGGRGCLGGGGAKEGAQQQSDGLLVVSLHAAVVKLLCMPPSCAL